MQLGLIFCHGSQIDTFYSSFKLERVHYWYGDKEMKEKIHFFISVLSLLIIPISLV